MSDETQVRLRIGQPLPEANLHGLAKVTQDDLQKARRFWIEKSPDFTKRLLDAKTVDKNK